MKILHIVDNLYAGGAEKLIEEMVPIMNKMEGVEAEVLLLSGEDKVFDKRLVENNINIKVVPLKNMRNPLQIFHIFNVIKKGGYDVVHAHLFPANYWTALASMFLFKHKPEMVTTEHNTHNNRRGKRVFKHVEKFIYSRFDKVISISEETHKNLVSWLHPGEKKRKKFKVIHNGINLEKFYGAAPYNKADIVPDFNDDTKILCMVGSFSRQKDQAAIIRAMKNLPGDIHLLLIGEGELKEEHESLARKLDVEGRVHFLGFRDDVERIFKTSDIVIVSSHWEGFGLVAAEGMAAGKPVLASDVPGLAAVVGTPDLLFEAENSGQLSELINMLTVDKSKYDAFAELCRQRSKMFDIHTMAEKYMEEYKESSRNRPGHTEIDAVPHFIKALHEDICSKEMNVEKVRDNVYIIKTEINKYLVKLVREEEKNKLGKVQKMFQNSSFKNEIEVNNALNKKDFEHLKFPRMIETKNQDVIVFEYIEALDHAGPVKDNFIPSLIEFQLTDLKLNLSRMDRLILNFRNKVACNILRWSFDVVFPRLGMKAALRSVFLFVKLSRNHHAFHKSINLHNDFGGNTILSAARELYVIDFESVVNEKKWMLVDVIQRVFDEDNFTLNKEDLHNYLSSLCGQLSVTLEEMNLKDQVRIILMRRIMQILRSGSRDENKKALSGQFLIQSVLSDEGYDLWYADNVDALILNHSESENTVL